MARPPPPPANLDLFCSGGHLRCPGARGRRGSYYDSVLYNTNCMQGVSGGVAVFVSLFPLIVPLLWLERSWFVRWPVGWATGRVATHTAIEAAPSGLTNHLCITMTRGAFILLGRTPSLGLPSCRSTSRTTMRSTSLAQWTSVLLLDTQRAALSYPPLRTWSKLSGTCHGGGVVTLFFLTAYALHSS